MNNLVSITTSLSAEDKALIKNLEVKLDTVIRWLGQQEAVRNTETNLPVPGESSFDDIKHRLGGMDRTTWDRLVVAGKAPPRIKRGRLTKYENAELIRYFNDKSNYRAST